MGHMQEVRTFGTKRNAKAHAIVRESNGGFSIKINQVNHMLIQDTNFRYKLMEIVEIIGKENMDNLAINVKVVGGGHVSQAYAARQAVCKGVVAFYGKFIDEEKKQELKNKLYEFDKFTLVADPRKAEAKKFGGPSARSKYTKSYR